MACKIAACVKLKKSLATAILHLHNQETESNYNACKYKTFRLIGQLPLYVESSSCFVCASSEVSSESGLMHRLV